MKHSTTQKTFITILLLLLISTTAFAQILDMDIIMPFKENGSNEIKITCGYGCGYHTEKDKYAVDFDLSIANNDQIVSVADGIIEKISYNKDGYGHYVVIKHKNGYKSLYAHLKEESIFFGEGDEMKQGEVIALAGNTGTVYPPKTKENPTAGDHLHFVMYDQYGNGVRPEPMYGDKLYATLAEGMYVKSGDYLDMTRTSSPNSYLSITPYTTALFTQKESAYFKAPQTVPTLPGTYSNTADFLNSYGTIKIDNDFLLRFIDTSASATGETTQPVEYNPEAAKIIAAINLQKEIESSQLSPEDLVSGLAKIQLAMNHAKEVGQNFEKDLGNLLSDTGLSVLKRFAGAMGTDIVYQHIFESFRAIQENIKISPELLEAVANETFDARTSSELSSLSASVTDKLKNMMTENGGVAMLISIALLLVLMGYLQKDRAKAEQNLRNILSSTVASATLSKYWNFISKSTQNWLARLNAKKDPDGNIQEAVAMHLHELQSKREQILSQQSMTKEDMEEMGKIDNSITLLTRIHKNTTPAKIHQDENTHVYETIDEPVYNSFFESVKKLLYFPGKVAAGIESTINPKSMGFVAGAQRLADGTIISYSGSTSTSPTPVATAQKPVIQTTLTNATELKINHWLSQYVVVGINDGTFIAADGKTYTDLNKAWDITRDYLTKNKKPEYFKYPSSDTYISLNYLPERNPYRGYKGNYIPYAEPILVASAGISDTNTSSSTQQSPKRNEGYIAPISEAVRSATSALYEKVNHWLKQYVVVGLSNGKYAAPDGNMYGNLSQAMAIAEQYRLAGKKALTFSTPDVRALTSYASLHFPVGKNAENYTPYEETYKVININASVGQGDPYSRYDNRLFGTQKCGIKLASYNDNNFVCTYWPSSDYPEGYNTQELRESAEEKINNIIESSKENDPYIMIMAQWENKIISPRFSNGISIGANMLNDVNAAGTYLLFTKLLDQSKGIAFKPTEEYQISKYAVINNAKNSNNAGMQIIMPPELPEDLLILQKGLRGGEQGKEDMIAFKKALEGITMTGGCQYKLKSSNLIFGTSDLVGLLRSSVKNIQSEMTWEKELKKRNSANENITKDARSISSLLGQISNLQQKSSYNQAIFVPDFGYLYKGYFFNDEKSLSEYKFWETHGGLMNPEMKNLLQNHARPADQLTSLDFLKTDPSIMEIISQSQSKTIDWEKVESDKQKRKEYITNLQNFLNSIKEINIKNVIPEEISTIPGWEKYAAKIRYDYGWRGDGFFSLTGSFKDAIVRQMQIDYQKLYNNFVTNIQKNTNNFRVSEISVQGQIKFMAADGKTYDNLQQASAINYVYMNNPHKIPVAYVPDSNEKFSMEDLEKGVIKSHAPLPECKLSPQEEAIIKFISVNAAGQFVDSLGKTHQNLQSAVKTTLEDIDKKKVVNGEIQEGIYTYKNGYSDYFEYLMQIEKDINLILQNGGFARDPYRGSYITPYGTVDTLETARQLTFYGNTLGWNKGSFQMLNHYDLERNKDNTEYLWWQQYYYSSRYGSDNIKLSIFKADESFIPEDMKDIFYRELKNIRFEQGWFKNAYNDRFSSGHRSIVSAIRQKLQYDQLFPNLRR